MPTVPKLDEVQTRVRGIGSPRFSLANLSVPRTIIPDTSNAFSKTRRAFEQLAIETKQKADDAALMEASNALDEWELSSLFDPDGGALTTRGKAAFDISDRVGEDFQKVTADLRSKLGNDDQRFAFDKLVNNRRTSITKSLFRHERSEMNKFQDAQFSAGIRSAQNRAFMHYNDPEEVANSVAKMQQIIAAQGNKRGLPAQTIQNSVTVQTSSLYKGTLEAALASDDPYSQLQAKGLFDDLREKGELLPKDILALDKTFDRVIPDAAAQVEFDQLTGGENRTELQGIASELNGQVKGSGDKFLGMAEGRDKNDFYAQLDQPGGAALALHDLDNGKYAAISGAEKDRLKKVAKTKFKKEADDQATLRAARAALAETDLEASRVSGTLRFSDIQAYEQSHQGDADAQAYAEVLRDSLSGREKALEVADEENRKKRQKQVVEAAEDIRSAQTFEDLAQQLVDLKIATGGDAKSFPDDVKLNSDIIGKYRQYRVNVLKALADPNVDMTRSQANTLLKDVNAVFSQSISADATSADDYRIKPGIQNPHGRGLELINNFLKNQNQETNLNLKRKMFMSFTENLGEFDGDKYTVTGEYKSTGVHAQDERVIRKALELARKDINGENFIGVVDTERTNQVVQPVNKRTFTVQKDASGNYAKVFSDGTFEEISKEEADKLAK